MNQNDKEPSDLDYEPVEEFLRNEALSRFPTGWVPTSLFDWEPPTDRAQTASSSAQEEGPDEKRLDEEGPDHSLLTDAERESSDQKRSRLERRRETMITEVWSQLSEFYDRNGYRALHELRQSLQERLKREQERISVYHDRREYLSILKADLRDCMSDYGNDTTVGKAYQEMNSGRRTEWSRPHDHGSVVEVSLSEAMLEERGIDPDNLRRHPWSIEMDEPLEQAFMRLHRKVELKEEQVVDLGDLIGLIRFRLRLLDRKLWLADLGGRSEEPPVSTGIPKKFRGRERPIQYCWMILAVAEKRETEWREAGWPTQSELNEILAEYYDFDAIHTGMESVSGYAAGFIRSKFGERYQNFRPDFYELLLEKSSFFESVVNEMETELLDQLDPPH